MTTAMTVTYRYKARNGRNVVRELYCRRAAQLMYDHDPDLFESTVNALVKATGEKARPQAVLDSYLEHCPDFIETLKRGYTSIEFC